MADRIITLTAVLGETNFKIELSNLKTAMYIKEQLIKQNFDVHVQSILVFE